MAIQFPPLKKTPKVATEPTVSSTSPYAVPNANMDGYDETFGQYNDSKFYSATGRIGRIKYLLYPMGFMLCAIVIFGLAMMALGGFSSLVGADGSTSGMPITLVLLSLLLIVALVYINITSAVRRLNDLNRSGWLALLLLVPVISNFFPLYLMFASGDTGRNDYGLPSAPPTTWMKVLAILMFVGVIAAAIGAALAIPAYQHYIEKAKVAQVQVNTAQGKPNNPSSSQTAEPAVPNHPLSEAIPTPQVTPVPTAELPQHDKVEKPLMVENSQVNTSPTADNPASNGVNFAQPTANNAPSDKSKSADISYEEFTKLSEGKVYQDPVHVKK